MANAYVRGSTNDGTATTGTTGTITPALSGSLVVLYVHGGDAGAINIIADAGAAWEPELFDFTPSSETAQIAAYWKIANGSEPAEYTFNLGSSRLYHCCYKEFSGDENSWEIDATPVNTITAVASNDMECEAVNGETVADDSISIIMTGKDNRDAAAEAYTVVNNSYTDVLGNTASQGTAMAHRLFTTGETIGFNVRIETADGVDPLTDKTFSAHVSFINVAASGGGFNAAWAIHANTIIG